MRTCPQCGYDNPRNAGYCRKCGADSRALPKERNLEKGGYLGKNYGFLLREKIGRGQYSEAWLAEDLKRRRRRVVLKILNIKSGGVKKMALSLRKTAMILIPHVHPNLVRCYSFERDETFAFMVMEYVEGPDLETLLKRRKTLTEEEILWAAREIFTGMAYIHRLGLVHGNLHAINFLLSQPPSEDKLPTLANARSHPHQCVKISDWVISRILVDINAGKSKSTPSRWKIRRDFDQVGDSIFFMLTGKEPEKAKSSALAIPDSASPLLKRLIAECWEADHNKRKTPAFRMIRMIEDNIDTTID